MHSFVPGKATDKAPPQKAPLRIQICRSPPPVEGDSEVEVEVEVEKNTRQAVKDEVDA